MDTAATIENPMTTDSGKPVCPHVVRTDESNALACVGEVGHPGDHDMKPIVKAVDIIHEFEQDALELWNSARRNRAPVVIEALLAVAHSTLHEACLRATEIYGDPGCAPGNAR